MTFGGYRVPHPLEPAIQVKVQTRTDNPGPVQAVDAALGDLMKELDTFSDSFQVRQPPPPTSQPSWPSFHVARRCVTECPPSHSRSENWTGSLPLSRRVTGTFHDLALEYRGAELGSSCATG